MKSFSLDSIIDDFSDYILCFYINISSRVQIVKITNIPNYYWERAIFSGQGLIFEAITLAKLEIYTSENVIANLNNVIPY